MMLWPWTDKAAALVKLGRYEEALKDYDKALQICPTDVYTLNLKAVLLLRLNPIDSVAWFNKGVALNNLRRYKEAVVSYRKVIQIGDNLVGALYNMGISLANLGNYKEAIKSYDKALELNPDDAQIIYEKAISLNNLGKHKDAEKLVSKARDMGLNV